MMSNISLSQVTLIAVGVENYMYMRTLHGPKKDIEKFIDILVRSPSTGLYQSSQVVTVINPNTDELRTTINEYVVNRSAQSDILIFYFSGHGIPVGQNDFGFCTTDSRIHEITGGILPLTVLRFRDLIDTLRIMNITPIIIIDACFSGIAGNAMVISESDAIENMHREISRQNATNYALISSCSDRQFAIGNSNGGIFSQILFDILVEGFPTSEPEQAIVHLQDIFPSLIKRVNSIISDSTPQLFLGKTIPLIPLSKNSKYKPRSYKFTKYLHDIIASIWNNGDERELTKKEINLIVGSGAYGNHRKLSYKGWDLLEDNPQTKKRRLTERGRQFAQGNLLIPEEVFFDPITKEYIASPDSKNIGFTPESN